MRDLRTERHIELEEAARSDRKAWRGLDVAECEDKVGAGWKIEHFEQVLVPLKERLKRVWELRLIASGPFEP